MQCDGCNGIVRGVKFRCLECDDVVFCQHCQRGGIHSHHTVVEYNDTVRSAGAEVSLHRHPQRQSTPSHPYVIERGPSAPSLPYCIVPVAPPIVQPSTNFSFVETQPNSQGRNSPGTEKRRCALKPDKAPEIRPRDFQPYSIAPVVPSAPRTFAASHPKLDDYTARWAPAKPSAPHNRVELSETDPEFQTVLQNVDQMGGKKFTSNVDKICRIENYRLYKTYNSCREDMERVNDPGTVNERILWHGTSADVLGNLYRDGFNRSYCGKNATAYGNGVYFATSFEYSASSTYSPPDTKGQKYIFQCRVLTGQFTKGEPDLKEAPMRTPEFRFDSVVDSMSAPTMFIVFKDMQVYPEYVITLKL